MKKITDDMTGELMNQTEYAELMGIKRPRVSQLIKDGHLLTKIRKNRTLVVNCDYNSDIIQEFCRGTGKWSRSQA
jgi:predicted XRE-type DNA-binding protein